MASPGYLASFAEGSFAQQAAADADAAAAAPHELVPPAIELSPEFVIDQQARFRGLMAEGRPGAAAIHEVYVEDERLQDAASLAYDQFVSSARLATGSVVRYDALSASLNSDGDVASNFVLDAETRKITQDQLQASGANLATNSVGGAMRSWSVARNDLMSTSKKVKAQALRAKAAEEATGVGADEEKMAEIEAKIAKVEQVGALIDVGVGAVTGAGATSLGDAKDALLDSGNLGGAVSSGAELAGADVDVTSVSGVAGVGARLYYGKEITALRHQITAGKKAVSSLSDSAARGDLEALLDDLVVKLEAHENASLTAENAMEDRRKQYAGAGKEVDANARSAGAEEGEVSESLLLGSAAEEASLMVGMGKDAGATAEAAVADARTNARKRDDSDYYTGEDTMHINGRDHYLPRGRYEQIGDDPDYTALYQMEKAITRWQAAADQAVVHLAGVTGSFRENITDGAGNGEF